MAISGREAAIPVGRSLARWMAKGSAPSSIPSFVNEAMNAAPAPPSNVFSLTCQPLVGTDAKVAGWAAIAEQLREQGSA